MFCLCKNRLRASVTRDNRARDRGDTLLEILVALMIISLAAVALIGSLLVSTSSSITNRGMVNLDGVLRSMAESARYEIQTRPQDGTNGPLFDCSLSNYPMISDPYPDSGTPGVSGAPGTTAVVVFGAGFTAGTPTVTVGGTPVNPMTVLAGSSGDYTIMFTPPNTGQVTLSDGTNKASSRLPFTTTGSPRGSTPGTTASTYSNYKLASSVVPSCSSNTAAINLTLVNSDPGNAASDQLGFVVGNFAPQPVLVTATSSPVAPNTTAQDVPATVTFTASITDHKGMPITTGSVAWTVTYSGPGTWTGSCPSTGSPFQCTVSAMVGQSGIYQATATYSGAAYPTGNSGTSAIKLQPAQPMSTLSANATNNGGPLVFTDTVVGSNGVSPSSTTQPTWLIQASDGATPTCDSTSGPTNPDSVTSVWTCTLNSPNTSDSYDVSATYIPGSNPNYGVGFAEQTFAIPVITVTGTANRAGVVTFKVTSVTKPAGYTGPANTDTITWNITTDQALPPFAQPCTTATPLSGASASCSFLGLAADHYTATVTFANSPGSASYDQNYAADTATSNTVTG